MAFLFFTIGIFEENYDDVGVMEENTGSNTQGQNPEPICDENYDDLDTVKEQALQIQNGKVIFFKDNTTHTNFNGNFYPMFVCIVKHQ